MTNARGPKYSVDIEETLHEWSSPTISTSQIRELGGLPANVPVVLCDLKDGTSRELAEDEVVELKPGMGFSKKVRFKRGFAGKPEDVGPKYSVDIEETLHEWSSPTISTSQIRELGGLPANVPVVLCDLKDGTSRELAEDEVVELKPGMGFSKKVRFKRGDDARLYEDLEKLKVRYPTLSFRKEGGWVRIDGFRLPAGVYDRDSVDACFMVGANYPDASPYGFFVSPPVKLTNGDLPGSYNASAGGETPFEGEWGKFSVSMEDWQSTTDPKTRSTITDFVNACTSRLDEGK